MRSFGIRYLELRGVNGKNVLDLDQRETETIRATLKRMGFRISAIGSPLGKIKISDDFTIDSKRLRKALSLAHLFDTRYVRIFSYYLPRNADPLSYREEVLRRLGEMTRAAKREDTVLLLENERGIYGDIPERCLDILKSIDSDGLRFTFDPANFVLTGVKPYQEAFPAMVEHIEYLHIKDARFSDGKVMPAGEGDGEIRQILKALQQRGFTGFLSLEPHLAIAGKTSGFSGASLFTKAVGALKGILEEI